MLAAISCADDQAILLARLDPAAETLSEVATIRVPGPPPPSPSMPLALSLDGRHLYAALRAPPWEVASFAIDAASGTLRHRGNAPLPASLCAIATDRTGRFLLGASYDASVVTVSAIGEDGAVAGPALQVVRTPPKAHSILVDPANRFATAASLGGDALLTWPFDPAAGLQRPQAPMATAARPGAGPRHFRFAASGARLYAVNELDGTIDAFDRDPATGALVRIETVPLLDDDPVESAAAADIHLTPDESLLYASVRCDSTIVAFRVVPASGRLHRLGRFPVEQTPRAFAIDPHGRSLLCAGRDAAMVGVWRIDGATGALARTGGLATPPNPNWIEFLPEA